MSTTVKGVGSIVTEMYPVQGAKGAAGNGDFQKIWSSQMSKGASENATGAADGKAADYSKAKDKVESSKDVKKESALKAKEPVKNEAKTSQTDRAEGELTKEELEKAMEKLGSAALELMQQIADTFGISMEELQAAMDALGMENTDVLDASKLNGLLLNLGGAEDSYALITDEALYEKYRSLMEQQDAILEECAEDLGVDVKALEGMLKQEPEAVNAEDDSNEALIQVVETTPENQTEGKNPLTDGEKNSENRENSKDMNHEFTAVAQSVNGEQYQAQVEQADGIYTSSSWDVETQDIMRQIMDSMKMQLDADNTSMEMQLHPASLGNLQVNVASKGGVITANFITENEAVKSVLESQMIQLKESFAEQGVKVEAIEVTVQPHAFEQNLEQGRGRDQQDMTEKKSRTRRINLDDLISMGGLEEVVEEEDALDAEMLMINGGTVDYTV